MDNVATTGRLRFRRRYSPHLQYTTTNARKTSLLAETSTKLGLRPNESKTKVMKINAKRKQPIKIKNTNLEEVEEFTYLGSIVNIEGGTYADVKNWFNKDRVILNILGKVWSAKNISRGTKMKIFNSNVKCVLLYEAETRRTTKVMLSKIQRFINYCLRKIMNIRWFDKVRNEDLWQRAKNTHIKKRKWAWIGHTLRKSRGSITRQALKWNLQGQKSRGRPRNTGCRDTESELKEQEHNWNSAENWGQIELDVKGHWEVSCNWVYNVLPFSKSSAISPNKLLQIISLTFIERGVFHTWYIQFSPFLIATFGYLSRPAQPVNKDVVPRSENNISIPRGPSECCQHQHICLILIYIYICNKHPSMG